MTDSNKGIRILIVEDNPADQYLITELLSASVINIQLLVTAEKLKKAVDILQKEPFDIILLDLFLPDSSGIGTFKTLNDFAGKMPVIILSGLADMNLAIEAIALGAQDYLLKEDMDKKVLGKMILYSIERKHNLEKLRESEAKYRLMIERNLAGVYQTTPDGKILTCNDAFAKMLGYGSHTELLQKKASEFYFLSSHRTDIIAQLLEKGGMTNKEIKLLHKNGTPVHVIESCTLIKDPVTGEQIIEGVILDITDRQKAEDKIRESEVKYRTLMQQAGDSILLFTGSGQLIEANQIARQLLGYSMEEYKKMSLKDLFFEEDIKQSPLRFDLLNKGESTVNRRRLKRKGGAALETEIHAKKLSDGRYLGVARDLTERIKAEEQLRGSEEKYRTLVEHASDGIVIVEINGICVEVNSTICHMLGYTKEELSNRNLFELVVINKGDVPLRIAEVLAGKSVLQERNVLKKDGGTLAVELNSKLLPDNRILVIVRDITERRQIEDALRQSNERNDIVAKATSDVIWDWNLVTGKVYRSKEGLKNVYGYNDNAPIEMVTDWNRQVHPDDREMMEKLIEKILQPSDQTTFSAEYRFLRQDGKYANVFDRGYIIRDEHGKPVRMIGAAQDITERKKTEDKILKSEEQYRDIVDNITDIICTYDLNGRILSANRAAEILLEHRFNPGENLNIRDILAADTKDSFYQHINEIKKNGHAQGLMKVQTYTGKIRIWEYNNSLKTTGAEGPVVRGHAWDITERRKTEKEIKRQKEQYDDLVKNIPVGVYKFRMKPDGSMSLDYISPRLCKMIGVKEEDAYQDIMNTFKVVHPDDFGRFMKLIEESYATKQKFLWEGRAINNDQVNWVRIESSPKVLEDGDILWDGVIADITERRKAEDALRESEETFRRLFNESADAILLLDDTGFTECNQSAASILGYSSPQEVLIKQPWEISPERQPDGRLSTEKAEAMIAKALQQGYNRFEWVHTKLDGTEFPVEVMLTPIIVKGKQSFYTIWRDITERKNAEERIRINEARLTKAQQIGKLGYWQQELNSNMIWGSEEARKIYGFSPVAGELAEETVAACIPDFEMVRQAAVDLVKHNKKYEIEFQINPADGSPLKYISALAEIEKDEQGMPVRIMGVLKDITEYKKAEEQILKEKKLSDSIINSLPGVFYLQDYTGKYLRWNKQFETVTGYSAQEITKLDPLDFFEGEEKAAIINKIGEVLTNGSSEIETVIITKSGKRIPYYLSGQLIQYEDKPCFIGVGIDITERKKAEENQQRQFEELQQLYNFAIMVDSEESIENIYYHAMDSLLVGLKADRCSILLFDPDGVMRFKASKGLSDAYLKAAEGHSPWKPDTINPAPVFIEDVELEPGPGELRSVILGEGIRSLGFFPLINQQRLIGKFMVYYNQTHVFNESEIGFVQTIAHNIAFCVEKKKITNDLRQSEEKYRTLVNQAGDAIALFDRRGKVLEVNSSASLLLGYSYEELMDLTLADILTEDELRDNPVRYDMLEKGETTLKQRIMKRKDGTVVETEVNSKILPDGRFLSIVRDITERKIIEQELRKSQENYSSLLNTVDGIVWEASAQTFEFGFVSKQAERLLGYPVERWISEPTFWSDHIHPDDRNRAVNYCMQCTRDKKSHEFEYRMIAADGRFVWLRDIVTVIVENDQPVQLRGLMVDITERKKTEEEIKIANERFEMIAKATNDAVWDWNLLTNETWGNETLYQLYSLNPQKDKLSDVGFYTRIHPEDKERIKESLKIAFEKSSQSMIDEYRFKTEDGTYRTVVDRAYIQYDEEGKPVRMLGAMQDITKRKRAEQELKESYKAIRKLTEHLQNIREEERAHIAREIHDELGQKLTVLKMDISWINKKIGVKEEAVKARMKELIAMLDETVGSVRRISSDLRPSLLDDLGLTAAMEWQLNEFEKRFEIKTCFKAEGDDTIKLPESVKIGLFRIFQESLTNVARHSKAKKVTVKLNRNNSTIILSIEDDGIGFDKQNAIGKKTLGILGMKERTTMIGGTYDIISKPGNGTRVVVTIPLTDKTKTNGL